MSISDYELQMQRIAQLQNQSLQQSLANSLGITTAGTTSTGYWPTTTKPAKPEQNKKLLLLPKV